MSCSSGAPSDISEWPKTERDGATFWEKNDISYCDSNGDGQVDSKKIGSVEDAGQLWVDTNKDGFFDSVYEVTDAGDQFLKTIHIRVPSTRK